MKKMVFANDGLTVSWLKVFTNPTTVKTLKRLEATNKVAIINELAEIASELVASDLVVEALVEASSNYNKIFSLAEFAKGYNFVEMLKLKMEQTLIMMRMHHVALKNNCLTKEAIKAAFEFYIMAAILILFWDQK